jgi:acyl carrier protein
MNTEKQLSKPLLAGIKQLIVESCDLSLKPDELNDHTPLFGPESPLSLDSIDALQISVAVQKKYGVSITDSKVMRRVSESIATLTEFIQSEIS